MIELMELIGQSKLSNRKTRQRSDFLPIWPLPTLSNTREVVLILEAEIVLHKLVRKFMKKGSISI